MRTACPAVDTSADANDTPERAGRSAACQKATERVAQETAKYLYRMDTGMRRLAGLDAQPIAKKLAHVAEQVSKTARSAYETKQERSGQALEALVAALEAGQDSLLALGWLGQDLGEVVGIGVRRIRRCLAGADYHCAHLAADHLAGRLRAPQPSFASQASPLGGGPSSDASDEESQDGDPGDTASAWRRQSDEIEQLARDHQRNMDRASQSAQTGAGDGLNAQGQESSAAGQRQAARNQALREASATENELARRAQGLRDQQRLLESESQAAQLLEQASSAMEQAAKSLQQLDPSAAFVHQTTAQRLVEKASQAVASNADATDSSDDDSRRTPGERSDDASSGKRAAKGGSDGSIPSPDAFEGPEAFRRRVLEGLKDASHPSIDPRMRKAIERYAERLLR